MLESSSEVSSGDVVIVPACVLSSLSFTVFSDDMDEVLVEVRVVDALLLRLNPTDFGSKAVNDKVRVGGALRANAFRRSVVMSRMKIFLI